MVHLKAKIHYHACRYSLQTCLCGKALNAFDSRCMRVETQRGRIRSLRAGCFRLFRRKDSIRAHRWTLAGLKKLNVQSEPARAAQNTRYTGKRAQAHNRGKPGVSCRFHSVCIPWGQFPLSSRPEERRHCDTRCPRSFPFLSNVHPHDTQLLHVSLDSATYSSQYELRALAPKTLLLVSCP